MIRNNQKLLFVLVFFFLFLGIIAPLINFEITCDRSVNSVQNAPPTDDFGSIKSPPDTGAKPSVKKKSEPTGMKSRELFSQTKPKFKKLFEPAEFSFVPKLENPVKKLLMAATENSEAENEKEEGRNGEPDGALKFRRLQMQDEKGEIPLDGLQKAREQMDKMRAFYRNQAKIAGKPDGMEVAGLAPGDWTWLGPGNIGGRIRSIVIDPNNPLNIWAGSVSGGIWKSTNAGNSWQPVNDFMANLAVTSLIIHPSNTTIMYAATGEGFGNTDAIQGGGVFQSTDSGNTWNLLGSTNPAAVASPGCGVGNVPCPAFWTLVNRLAIASNGTLLAATSSGIARSINGGTSWTQQTAVAAMDIDFDPNNSLNAIVGEVTQCPRPPGPPCAGSVQFSSDGGVNWNPSTFNPPITNGGTLPTNGRVELAYAPSSSNIVYASVNQNQGIVYRSSNFGQTFNQVSTTPNLLGTVGWYANALWVNPNDPTFILVGGLSLYQSGDSGVTFAIKANGSSTQSSSHADHHAIIANPTFDDNTDKSVYFGNDGGVYRVDDIRNFSTTSGWTERNNNLGITQFYGGAVTLNGVVFGGTQDNGTIRVLPIPNVDPPYDTENWIEFFGNDGGYVAADPTDSNYLYGEMQNMGLIRSSNGGASASFIYCNNPPSPTTGGVCPGPGISDAFNGANFSAPFVLDPFDPNTMLAGGLSLWHSSDVKTAANPTWTVAMPPNPTIPPPGPAPTPTPAPNPISAVAVSPSNSNFIAVAHNDGQIFLSVNGTNGTPTWNPINAPPFPAGSGRPPLRLVIDNTRNPNWIYATFGGFANNNVWVTKDLGATWIDVSGVTGTATDLPAVPVRSLLINPADNKKLYVGTEVGIFASEDAGATWQLPNGGPANVSVDELFFYQGDLFAATHGRGIYKTFSPVLDVGKCEIPGGNPPIQCPSGTNYCPYVNPPVGGCCKVGDWDCPCTWASSRVPNQNLDVVVACPITIHSTAFAKNMSVTARLTLESDLFVGGDVTNTGLIESGSGFQSSLSANNLVNIRPNAVTNAGVITLSNGLRISGDIANYGILTGGNIIVNKTSAPFTTLHRLSGNGFWGNSSLNLNQTALLESDLTFDVGVLSNSGLLDIGANNLNFNGNNFQTSNQLAVPNAGLLGTGSVNFNPSGGSASLSIVHGPNGPVIFQPSLRIFNGTVNANIQIPISGSLTVDPSAVFNFNEGTMDLNGDLTVNGMIGKTSSPSVNTTLNFNGATLNNNGSIFTDFLYFNNTGTPRNQSITGTGNFGGTSAQIGLGGSPSTTTLNGNVIFNQGQFSVGNGSTLNIGNSSTLTFTGDSLLNAGNIIGSGTLIMQPNVSSTLSGIGSYSFASGITIGSGTVTPSLRTSGSFMINSGATLSGGSLIFLGNTFTNNGSVVSTSFQFDGLNFQPVNQQLGGTGTFTGSGGQLYVSPRSTTTLFSNVTYAGSRIYNENLIDTGTFTLTLPCPTGSEGPGEIIGNVRRTNLAACSGPMAFGSPFTTIQFISGTPPMEISVNTALNPPAGFPNAVRRTYFITPIGGSNYTANLRLHYLDSELNGNDETTLQLFRNNGTNWLPQGATGRNTTDNWVEYSGVTQFSPWAIAALQPTAANVSVGGRVYSAIGRGIPNVFVNLIDANGQMRSVRTNPFGYYRFDEVSTGRTYIFTATHKEYRFTPQVVSVTDEITELNFTAEP